MQKLRTDRFAVVAGFMVLSAAVVAFACTTKSASLVGRISTAAVPAGGIAPAGSTCEATGQACCAFEVMSATDADGKALTDLTGKTLKAICAKNMAMPAGWTNETIMVAKADLDWDKQMVQIASMETASEAVAVAAKANWEKFAVANASAVTAGGKAGCCAAGAKAASSKGASCGAKVDGAAASSGKASCGAKADGAAASSGKSSCGAKTDGAAASSGKGSCGAKTDGAAASSGKGSCHGKSEASAAAAARALVLNVSGMTCGGCASKVEKALMAVKGVSGCKVNLESKNAKVDVADEVKPEDLVKAVEGAGFKAEIAATDSEAPAKG